MLESVLPIAQARQLPLFLVGHSMGGGETLYWLATSNETIRRQIRGFVALAPYIALNPASQPSRALVAAGKLALRLLPRFQMEQKLNPDNLCRDPELAKSWELDELCHNIGTLEGMGGMIDRGEELEQGKVTVKEGSSLYIAHGSDDRITNHDSSVKFFDRLQIEDKTIKSYEGWYHVCEFDPPFHILGPYECVVHCEPGDDKITFANDVSKWILARASSPVSSTTQSRL